MQASGIELEFDRRPSALRYMALAFWPSPRLDERTPIPSIVARWRNVRVAPRDLEDFRALAEQPRGEFLPLLLPHALGFRLQMAVLTQPAFPVPIWRMLQVRNRLVQHRAVACGASVDFEVRLADHRVLDKGFEVDLHCALLHAGTLAWESRNTFYARGRFGFVRGEAHSVPSIDAAGDTVARWAAATHGALRFGALTGDYNGIHLWNAYARGLGFRRAFLHPQRVLGACLARLAGFRPEAPQMLEALLKGPVPYGADVSLRARANADALCFSLSVDADPRPALLGRWQSPPATWRP